ncbi:MAG TPA: hypothetical protein PKE55_10290 [Kiritimatiellia bacterium]|nr:hypothetical protein [Kiritimatiellia bacterium]
MKGGEGSTKLFRHSLFLFMTTQVANVSNLLYQVVTGRNLTTEEYGVLATMMSLLLITATPMEALRTSMAHYVARAIRLGREGTIPAMVGLWCRRLLLVAVPIVGLGFAFSSQVAVFFQLPSPKPFELTCLLIACTLFLPLLVGVFQGAERFIWLSMSMHVWTILRVGIAYVLVLWVPSAFFGIAAHGLALALALLISAIGLFQMTRGRVAEPVEEGMGGYFVRTLLLLGAYAVLMNADLLFVKHLFEPEDAGLFARAATIGRSVIFLPMPIALVMFPKVVSIGKGGREGQLTLLKAMGLVVALVSAAVAAVMIVPWLPLWLMYNDRTPTPEMIHLLISVVIAMAPLGISYLLINYEMARHHFEGIWILGGGAVLYVVGVVIWHDTMLDVVRVMTAVNTLTLISLAGLMFRRTRTPKHIRR